MKAHKRNELTQVQAQKLVDYINNVGKDEVLHDLSKAASLLNDELDMELHGVDVQKSIRTLLWLVSQITSPD